jgi:hypothetical protein
MLAFQFQGPARAPFLFGWLGVFKGLDQFSRNFSSSAAGCLAVFVSEQAQIALKIVRYPRPAPYTHPCGNRICAARKKLPAQVIREIRWQR